MSRPVFRFAPSPNGYLHLGHALSALTNFEMARRCEGQFLLRIEDIDRARCRAEFETAIFEDLEWLGIAWNGPVRRQSEHLADYATALARLEALGLVYPSFESRQEIVHMVAARQQGGLIWPHDPDGAPLYPGRRGDSAEASRRVRGGEPHALRLDMAAALERTGSLTWREFDEVGGEAPLDVVPAAPEIWGDVILARKEIATSYHLSVVVDDALQGVTDVVRGQDLFAATSVHRMLQELLGLPAPRYHHHRLILANDGKKLSKSTKATALRDLRREGVTPDGIRTRIGLPPRPPA